MAGRHPTEWRGFAGCKQLPIAGGNAPTASTLERIVTYVDVLDPANRTLVLSQAFRGRILRLISPELAGEVREDADRIPVWDIFRVAIRRPSRT